MVAGYVANIAASLIGLRLLTSVVRPEVYGTVSLLLGVLMLSQHVFVAPFQQAAFRFFSEFERRGDLPRLRHVVRGFVQKSAALLFVLLLAGGLVWSAWHQTPYACFAVLAVLLLVQVVRAFEHNLLWAARRQRTNALMQAGDSWLKPALAFAMVMVVGATPQSVLGGYLLAEVIGLGVLFAFVPREGLGRYAPSPANDDELAAEIRSYAWPLAPVAIASWTSNLSDRYIIGAMVGPAAVGLYSAPYGLVSQPFIMAQAVAGQTFSPHYFNAVSSNDDALARKAFRAWMLGTLALCGSGVIGIIALRDWIAWAFLAPEYREGAALMPWIAAGNSLFALAQVLTLRLQAQKRTQRVMIAHGLGALASIAVTVPLTWRFGVLGTAIACPCYFGILLVGLAVLGSDRFAPRAER